jgi:hypothetical protein
MDGWIERRLRLFIAKKWRNTVWRRYPLAVDLSCARPQTGLEAEVAPTQESGLRENCTSRLSERAEAGRNPTSPDSAARKPTNKAGQAAAEPVERRAEAEGNASQQSTAAGRRTKCVTGAGAHTTSRKATEEGTVHLALPPSQHALLRQSFLALKRDAAPGADGLTWHDYEGPACSGHGSNRDQGLAQG